MFGKVRKIHFVGIGGAGMCGLAELLHNLGFQVSGSDLNESEAVKRLRGMGVKVALGHSAKNPVGSEVVVYSSAISADNPELVWAHQSHLPVIPRAEMLAELMRLKKGIAVAGTHGKTTTTSMLASILAQAGLDPTFVIGGRLNSIGANAKLGEGDLLVAEADESDGSFLKLSPIYVIVTNIDRDHLDYYPNLSAIQDAFVEFINKVPFYGSAFICGDDPNLAGVRPRLNRRIHIYGMTPHAELSAKKVKLQPMSASYRLVTNGEERGEITVSIPGQHNVYNSLAAIGVALELGVELDDIKKALANFYGIEMRFQVVGKTTDGIIIMHDYAHHPTEIKATLTALADSWHKRILAVFQPHRYTRTQHLLEEFARAFFLADELVVTDIYSAGESPISGVQAEKIVELAQAFGHRRAVYIADKAEIPAKVAGLAQPNDMIIFLGAGDVWKVAGETAKLLEKERGRSVE
jgi:UDP-N-acetylmuramate--alanine ligase